MATCPLLMVLTLAALLALTTPLDGAQPAAPDPAPAPLNITAILVNGTNYNTFSHLLRETQVDIQINDELNDLANAFTIFAPTDAAFKSLKSGTLNALVQQDQVGLVLYHILPRYYSLDMFETASNPVRTQASGNHGAYTINVTTDSNMQVNISTGIVHTRIAKKIFDDSQQLAVYSLDKVLLPYDLFGPKPPASVPPVAENASGKSPSRDSAAAEEGTSGGGLHGRGVGWSLLVGGGFVAIAGYLF
ncbi:hypothetical protein GW17_00008793 [Ensete ventricosum]|nr:hypothetical protein GW17_00008793 [Ensete ventricosum]